jgi:hypothetical protein
MSKWRSTLASPFDPEHPLPSGTQTWEFGVARPESVVGLPTKAVAQLTEAQRQEERRAAQLRKLGEVRPGQSLPRVKPR